jgi:hypothetical protein
MFAIYREDTAARDARVVYFTELDEHNREDEINDAMRGELVFDGYFRNFGKEEAKRAVANLLARMNTGEAVSRAEIERELKPFMP